MGWKAVNMPLNLKIAGTCDFAGAKKKEVEHREDRTFKKGNYNSISVFILYDRLLKY